MTLAALAAALALAAPPAVAPASPATPDARRRVAVLELRGLGLPQERAQLMSEIALTEASTIPGLEVIGRSEIVAMIGFEKEKAMLGCADDGRCVAEIAGALGVDWVLVGSVGQVETIVRVDLRLLDARRGKVGGRAGETVEGGAAKLVPAVQAAVHKLLDPLAPRAAAAAPAPAAPPGLSGLTTAALTAAPAAGLTGRKVGLPPLPGGTFYVTDPTGVGPASHFRIGALLLDATEVTVAEYAECVRARACSPADAAVEWDRITPAERTRWAKACNADRADRADHPVNCVDRDQAAAYCAWVGKRLPTEEEWEWAARRGDEAAAFPWGGDLPFDQLCWSGGGAGSPPQGTCPVGSYPAGRGAGGHLDLAGGVWEWTSSDALTGVSVQVAQGALGMRVAVARGGGWASNAPADVSAKARLLDKGTRKDPRIGFRCAKSP